MREFSQDNLRLDYLLSSIVEGALKLPSFQRDFKWKPSQIVKLLDSIQKKHPAGSLLFLEVNPRKKMIKDEPFKYSGVNDEVPADYLVLDGQQRLTSCYCVFHNKGTKTYFLNLSSFYIELKTTGFDESIDFENHITVKKYTPQPDQYLYSNHLLPLSFLKSKTEMREKISSYKMNLREINYDINFINFLETKLEGYLDPFFDYRFPVIILPKTLELDAVCKVFQSINTTGLKLSAFDICVARFMVDGINLKDKIKIALENNPNLKPILDSDETLVLQTIALLADKSPKKNKLAENLLSADFNWWDKVITGMNNTIQILTDFGVGCDKNLSLLPYQPIIPVISALIVDREYETLPVPNKSLIKQKLRK
jgi:uncharacterized protein with ParB-like and HNH nuclease domain